jgi:hypothetical protein
MLAARDGNGTGNGTAASSVYPRIYTPLNGRLARETNDRLSRAHTTMRPAALLSSALVLLRVAAQDAYFDALLPGRDALFPTFDAVEPAEQHLESRASASGGSTRHVPADTLIHNARIYTMDKRETKFKNGAMTLYKGKITWLGKDKAVADLNLAHGVTRCVRKGPLEQPTTRRRINARGAALLPGLIDSHTHSLALGKVRRAAHARPS